MNIQDRLRQYTRAAAVLLARDRFLPEWGDWHDSVAPESSLVIFTAADSGYFKRFGLAFISSLAKQHPSSNVHFHLYDPDPACMEMISEWKSKLPSMRIGYSTEHIPAEALCAAGMSCSKQSCHSLYICCSRFLAAQRLHRDCGASVLVMDIDVIFAGKLPPLFDGADYALMPRLRQQNWCKRTLGGVVFASSSPLGREFLDYACLHIRKFLSRGLYWFAYDQYALYLALKHMKRRDALAHFRALTDEHVSFDLSADAPILYPKGKRKDGDAFNRLSNDATVIGQL